MEVIPLGPGFAAELRGITLVDVASNDAAYAAHARLSKNTPCWFCAIRT